MKMLMSDQNLQLLPDYEQRVLVLKELGFIDENSRVQLKGKVACEVCLARSRDDTVKPVQYWYVWSLTITINIDSLSG